MVKKLLVLVILGCFALTYHAHAQGRELIYLGYEAERYPENLMYILDKGDHFPREFVGPLRDVYLNHYDYTKGEITNLIISAYDTIQREKPDVTIYDVVNDVQRYTEDELGIDLTTYMAAYVRSQLSK